MSLLLCLIGLVSLSTDILDYTVIGNNLELYAIYGVVYVTLLLLILNTAVHDIRVLVFALVGLVVLTSVAFLSDFNVGFIKSSIVFDSEYGFLNTNQSSNLSIIRESMIVIIMFVWLGKSSGNNALNQKLLESNILLGFGFLALDGGRLVISTLGNFAFTNVPSYISVTSYLLFTIFIAAYTMILIGLKWRI